VIKTEFFFQLLIRVLTDPSSLAGKMLLTLVLDPLRGSSAIRMRTAANRAFSLPLVPSRTGLLLSIR